MKRKVGEVFRLLGQKQHIPVSKTNEPYDVVIVGAGVVGCALARRFSQTGLSVAVVERANDVGEGGASKSNSAISHCGFDADPGSLEAKLVIKASRQWPALAKHLKIPFQPVGALMLARTPKEMESLHKYYSNSLKNGVDDVELLSGNDARKMEPLVFEGEELLGGLHIPRECIVDPFATVHAYAETALTQGGCDFYFQTEVDSIKRNTNSINKNNILVTASKQDVQLLARNVINCTGLSVRQLADTYGGDDLRFTLNPRRGQFLVYDSLSRGLLNKILLPVPGPLGKGILITPTIFGNLLAGPTAEDLSMDELDIATQTTKSGLDQVQQSVLRSLPQLKRFSPIAQYAGARSNCKEGSYLFHYGDNNIVSLAGIRSTGLSASFAIADEVFDEMARRGMIAPKYPFRCEGRTEYPSWYAKRQLDTSSSESSIGSTHPDTSKKPTRDSTIVCYCEGVDKRDIMQALNSSPLVPNTTDAVKRRTRATTGRCQGFNCLVDVCKVISAQSRTPVRNISKRGPGSEWFPQYRDTLPFGYDRDKVKSSELFARSQLYASLPRTAWDEGEHFQVIVIGAGPAGCGVVSGLTHSLKTHKILLIDRTDRIGGIPARYPSHNGQKTFIHWTKFKMMTGYDFAEELRDELFNSPQANKIHIKFQSTAVSIDKDEDEEGFYTVRTHDGHEFTADCVVFATGAREANSTERGLVTGHRSSRVVFSNNLLISGGESSVMTPSHAPSASIVSVGSGLIPRSILEPATNATFVQQEKDEHPKIAQLFFKGGDSTTIDKCDEIRIAAPQGYIKNIAFNPPVANQEQHQALLLGGCLLPNREVLVRSGMDNEQPKGVLIAGNAQHSRFGAWPGVACYLHAKYVVARQVLRQIS